MIVVDTNIISYFFLSSDFSSVAQRLYRKEPVWLAPSLWQSEFRNVLALYMRRQQLPLKKAKQIMQEAAAMMKGLERAVSSDNVLDLINASVCSSYDCEFVALAQDLRVPLLTFDKKILRAFPNTAVSPPQFLAN